MQKNKIRYFVGDIRDPKRCEEICKKALEYLRVEMSDLNKSDKDYIRNFFKEYLLWIKIFKN